MSFTLSFFPLFHNVHFANPSKYSSRYFFGIFLQHRKMEASEESIVCTGKYTTNKNSAQFTSKQNTLYNCVKIQILSADHHTCPNHSFLTLRIVLFVSFRSLLYFSLFLYFSFSFFFLSPHSRSWSIYEVWVSLFLFQLVVYSLF